MNESRPEFVARKDSQRADWCVLVTWPDGRAERITGFATGAAAFLWIEQCSEAWLRQVTPM